MIPNRVVMIDHEGSALLGIVLGQKKERIVVITERGRELELQPSRIYPVMPQGGTISKETVKEKVSALTELRALAEAEAKSLSGETLWELVREDYAEITLSALTELFYKNPTIVQYTALRLLLLSDRVFFKRNKDTFSPRPPALVEELKAQAEVQRVRIEKRKKFLEWIESVQKSYSPAPDQFEAEIGLLEALACDEGMPPHEHKDALELLSEACRALHLSETNNSADTAYELLERLKIFTPTTNPVLIRHRLPQEPTSGELEIDVRLQHLPRQDFTNRVSFTIDDESTQDMDDAISLTETESGYELCIHITDVASYLTSGSLLDRHASRRGTSVYLPEQTIHMLPRSVCEQTLSLLPHTERNCISVIVQLSKDGDMLNADLAATHIKLGDRFSYSQVDALLAEGTESRWKFLKTVTSKLEAHRLSEGGFKVPKRDIQPEVHPNGEVTLIELDENAPARAMIGELMVLANSVFANFCAAHDLSIPYRTQDSIDKETTKMLSELPEGQVRDFTLRTKLKRSLTLLKPGFHATLGLKAYTQATSPVRRYLDIVVQRQILSWFAHQKPYYTQKEIEEILIQLDEPLQRANSATRESKRFWIMKYLEQRAKKNRSIEGVVVRVEGKNPLIEIDEIYLAFPIRTDEKLKLGDRVELGISLIDAKRDYFRFDVKRIIIT